MRRLKWVTLCALVTTACLGGGGSRPRVSGGPPPSASPAAAVLQGQWELVTVEAQGAPRPASGRLSYDEFNNIAVRAELTPEAGVTPPRVVLLDFAAKATVAGDELNYVALERRAPPEQMIPTAAEPSAWRHFSVEGDTLRVWQEDASGRPIGTMVFRRVR